MFDTIGTVANLPKLPVVANMVTNKDLDVTVDQEEIEQLAPMDAEKAKEAVKATEVLEKEKQFSENTEEFDKSKIVLEEEDNDEEPLNISLNFNGVEERAMTTKKCYLKYHTMHHKNGLTFWFKGQFRAFVGCGQQRCF